MKNLKHFIIASLVIGCSIFVATSYGVTKEQVIKRYLNGLKKGDVKEILSLFEPNGTVISTSKGKLTAEKFYSAFLPHVTQAKVKLSNFYYSSASKDNIAAKFHFAFSLDDGKSEQGEFVDEFIFYPHTQKLSQVIMFENLKF